MRLSLLASRCLLWQARIYLLTSTTPGAYSSLSTSHLKMLPRGHRGRFSRRQGSLLLQPGAGVFFGGSAQNGTSNSSQQPESNSTLQPINTESTGSTQSNAKSSTQSLVQSSSASAPPSTNSPVASTETLSNVVFGPSQVNGALMPYSSDTSSDLTSSSSTSTTQSTPLATSSLSTSSQTGDSTILSSSLSGSTTSSVPSIPTSSSSVTATPVSDVAPSGSAHPAQFYAGIAFLVIVVVAFVLSIVAWLLRSRRGRLSWCFGSSADEDAGSQEANMGLGLFLEKAPANADLPWIPPDPAPNLACSTHPYTLPTINRISDSPYPAMMRPSSAHVRTDTVQSSGQLLGPLQVQNYMAGDFSSSSENLTKQTRTARETDATSRGQDPFGGGRFLAPPTQVSPAPWAPLNVKSVRTPEQVHISRSPALRSIKARHEDGHDSDIPPLPSPHFDRLDAPQLEDNNSTDGWGAALRSSFFSALSAVRGQPTKPSEDRFTSLPSRNNSRQKYSVGIGDIFPPHPRAPDANPVISTSASAPIAHTREKTPWDVESYNTTAPLTLRKKNTLINGSENPSMHKRSDSRNSSIYTCTPGLPGDFPGKRKSTRRRAGALSGPSQISIRPPFLKRGTSGASVTSFSSTSSSEDAQGHTDAEAFAKRVMMLRERRKKAMSRRATVMRQSSSLTASRSGSKYRLKLKV